MKSIDKTIDVMCNWIQGKLEKNIANEVPEMATALAELISARADCAISEQECDVLEKRIADLEGQVQDRQFVPEDSNGKHYEIGEKVFASGTPHG